MTRINLQQEIELKINALGFTNVQIPSLTEEPQKIHSEVVCVDNLGLLKNLFTHMSVHVHVWVHEGDEPSAVIRLEFNWKHPSGSNGHSVFHQFSDGRWV
jgi:hypothetical protein